MQRFPYSCEFTLRGTGDIKTTLMNLYLLSFSGAFKGESGESCNNNYSLDSACPICGTGAELAENLVAKGLSGVKADFFQTFDTDYLISERLYLFMKNQGIKVEYLTRVLNVKGKDTIFFHLASHIILPKASDKTTGLTTERQCPVCKRNGYFNETIHEETPNGIKRVYPPIKLVYENVEDVLFSFSDVFHTWECTGWSNLKSEGFKAVRYARPMLIVSERIKNVFEKFGVKKSVFEEVTILDNAPVLRNMQ